MILYTRLVQQAIADMARVAPALRHIDPARLLVVAAPRVSSSHYGNLAQCFALREAEEENFSFWYHPDSRRVVRATPWTRRENTRVIVQGVEMLYLVLVRLPRLLAHGALETVAHELVHIGPDFDGRMRRLRHGARFDSITRECVAQWRRHGDPALIEALDMPLEALTERWGSLAGVSFGPKFVTPRLCRMSDPPPMASHPEIRRRRLRIDPDDLDFVEPKWTPDDTPGRLTERDLVYRVYTAESARRISASAINADRGLFPALASSSLKSAS